MFRVSLVGVVVVVDQGAFLGRDRRSNSLCVIGHTVTYRSPLSQPAASEQAEEGMASPTLSYRNLLTKDTDAKACGCVRVLAACF